MQLYGEELSLYMCIDHFEKPQLQAVALKNRSGKLSCLCFFDFRK